LYPNQSPSVNALPVKFAEQEFSTLRREHLTRKLLFEDSTFPASAESLGYKELSQKSGKIKNIGWKRPKVGGQRFPWPVLVEGGSRGQECILLSPQRQEVVGLSPTSGL
uniref:Calpain catalytic domain-containing protein n=1 Tax=Callorhinchus milii TaxID=7868 RepID=A0A4W3J716_CALMI